MIIELLDLPWKSISLLQHQPLAELSDGNLHTSDINCQMLWLWNRLLKAPDQRLAEKILNWDTWHSRPQANKLKS